MVLKKLGVPDEHYTAIGQVAALWAIFESLLDLTIWGLSGMDRQRSICITSQIAGALPPRGGEKLKPPEQDRRNNPPSWGEKRNRVVHDPWVFDNGKILRLEATARKTLNYKNVAVDTERNQRPPDRVERAHPRLFQSDGRIPQRAAEK